MRLAYVAGGAVAVALLAGCGPAGSTNAASGTSTTTSSNSNSSGSGTSNGSGSTDSGGANTTSTTGTGGTGGTGSAGGAGSSTRSDCETSDLRVSIGGSDGAAGSVYLTLDFKNVSGSPCAIYGFPGVSLAGGSPVKEISPGADRSPASKAKLITIAAGATVTATLQVAEADNYPVSSCAPKNATYLQIFPPNNTGAIDVAYSAKACTKSVHQLVISAVQ